jgi:hypothetical protein
MVTDLANYQIQQGIKQPPHRLEIQADSCSNATTSQCVEQQATLKSKGAWAHRHAHKHLRRHQFLDTATNPGVQMGRLPTQMSQTDTDPHLH